MSGLWPAGAVQDQAEYVGDGEKCKIDVRYVLMSDKCGGKWTMPKKPANVSGDVYYMLM